MRWKVLAVEIVLVGLIAGGAVYWHDRRPLGPAGSLNVALQESREANRHPPAPAVTEPTITQPPKVTVAPIQTHRKSIRRRIGPRTMAPAGKPGQPMDIRPRAARPAKVPKSISCKMVPSYARGFDRATIIAAAEARGLDADQTRQVLACLGK